MLATDRRHASRRIPEESESLSRLRPRMGGVLIVLDLSNSGAFVEGAVRLLPGVHVDIHVTGPAGRHLVRARVTRSRVSRIAPDAVIYRSALAFDRAVETAAPRQTLVEMTAV